MTYTFVADFDGTLQLRPGDCLEIKILRQVENGFEAAIIHRPHWSPPGVEPSQWDAYDVAIIRQTGVVEPPALGVKVTEVTESNFHDD